MGFNYIGVTAGITVDEVKQIADTFYDIGFDAIKQRFACIGFLVSEKTLNGGETKNKRFAPVADLQALMKASGWNLCNAVHYNTKNLDTLSEQVERLMKPLGRYGRAIQLNTDWPPPSEVQRIKEELLPIVILQVSYKAMDGLSNREIASRLAFYRKSVDYVLIDPSKGRGVGFDIEQSCDLYSRIREYFHGIVLAGGLSGDNLEEVLSKVIEKIGKDFSIDAEGKLRDKIDDSFFGNDVLNIDKVGAYLSAAKRIFGDE